MNKNSLWLQVNLDEVEKRGSEYLMERIQHYRSLEKTPAVRRFREIAKDEWQQDGEIEIDDNAVVSIPEEDEELRGAYVQAWIWIERPDSLCYQCQGENLTGYDGLCEKCEANEEAELVEKEDDDEIESIS